MGQRRVVNGKEQRFDDYKLDWVDVEDANPVSPPVLDTPPPQQLNLFVDTTDWIVRYSDLVPTAAMTEPDDFVCGACKSAVDKVTVFKGWMCERIDTATGEILCLEEDGIDDVSSIRYVCAKSCGWSAGESWWLDLNGRGQSVALDIETEEKAILPPPQNQITLHRDLWPTFDLSHVFGDNRIGGGISGGNSGGSIRTTSGTSGNTT